MNSHVSYEGWHIYADTGEIYRRWRMKRAEAELGIQEGDFLDDTGPDADPRFAYRTKADGFENAWTSNDESRAQEVLGTDELPRFRPPREMEIRMAATLERIGRSVEAMGQASAAETLAAVRRLVDGVAKPAAPSSTPPAKPQQNEHLRLERDDTYAGGERYRDWELLRDAPEISGRKGDTLREEDVGDATPFRLNRDGRQIGAPEWWQVRHLFAGLPAWCSEDTATEPARMNEARPADVTIARMRRAIPAGPQGPDTPYYTAVRVEVDIPAAGLHTGDILIYRLRNYKQRAIHVPLKPLPRASFATIVDAFDSGRRTGKPALKLIESSWKSDHELGDVLKKMRRALRSKRSMNAKTESSPICLLCDAHERVVPIEAGSDDAALFELLHEVGCRLPDSGGAS